jgi:hypothetical protein
MTPPILSKYYRMLSVALLLTTGFQASAQITGLITDNDTHKPISEADIFINRTTSFTSSGTAGEFELSRIPPGMPN